MARAPREIISNTREKTFRFQITKTKSLLGPVARVLEDDLPCVTVHEQARLLAVKALHRMFSIVTEQGLLMEPHAIREYQEMTDAYLVASHFLAARSRRLMDMRWRMTQKFHHLVHIAHHARFRNPRSGWTFLDEDLMGRIAKLCKAAALGRGHTRMSLKVVEKYLRQMYCQVRARSTTPWAIGM